MAIDGNTVVVGTYEDYSAFGNPSPSRPGRVYVYDGTTGALVRTITNPTPGYTEEGFGTAVAVQGNTLVVGAYMSYVAGNLPLGHVYVYDLSTGNLVRTLNDPAAGFNNLFGLAVSISGDRIAVGA